MTAAPYKKKFRPKMLKQLMLDCDITQADLARAAGCERPTVNLVANRDDYMPSRIADFRQKVEAHISGRPCCTAWLRQRGLAPADIWKPLPGRGDQRDALPLGHAIRTSRGMHRPAPLRPGDPEEQQREERIEMLTLKARKQFGLFRDPFMEDPNKPFDPDKDMYLSEDHRYIHMAMEETALSAGMMAAIGEVGSGKTWTRKSVVMKLKQKGLRIIFPQIVDKTRITAASICDAIILDLEGKDAKPKNKLEQKTRQVLQILENRTRQNIRMVMIIDEAQDLAANPRILKLFKRFNEMEVDDKKVLGIILIGQPELGDLLDESVHSDMREVIRRIQVAEIQGLNGNIKDYLLLKFKKVKEGAKLSDIITDGAITALGQRLTAKDRAQRDISIAYPLTVNNYMVRAMNAAAAHGEDKVTEDVIVRMI